MLFAIVPAAPPTRKNQRTTSWPAPISANVPYQRGSRLILSAFECVSIVSSFTSKQNQTVFPALNFQPVHQSPQCKARCNPARNFRLLLFVNVRDVTWRQFLRRNGAAIMGVILQAFYWDCP